MDNDALDSVNQLEGAVTAVLDGLWRLAPAAVEDGVGRGYARGRGRILRAHHADQHIERGPGVAASQRADFGDGLRHGKFDPLREDLAALDGNRVARCRCMPENA